MANFEDYALKKKQKQIELNYKKQTDGNGMEEWIEIDQPENET